MPPRFVPSRTIASRCSRLSSAGSITVAPSAPLPSSIVLVPGPVMIEGFGARRTVYGVGMSHLQFLLLFTETSASGSHTISMAVEERGVPYLGQGRRPDLPQSAVQRAK